MYMGKIKNSFYWKILELSFDSLKSNAFRAFLTMLDAITNDAASIAFFNGYRGLDFVVDGAAATNPTLVKKSKPIRVIIMDFVVLFITIL